MFFDYSTNETRPTRALEIALRARKLEQKQALMAAELRAGDHKSASVSRSLVARLLATLRIV